MAEASGATSQRKSNEEPVTKNVEFETLNFKVTPGFKREYKGYAVSLGMTMGELLKEGFELSKQKRSQ